jgi:hypothetical protein
MKYLFVGLGNPGAKYEATRHNIGFKVLEELARELGGTFVSQKVADVAEVKFKGRTLILVKPTTYMNLSGKAVNYYLQQQKILKENKLIGPKVSPKKIAQAVAEKKSKTKVATPSSVRTKDGVFTVSKTTTGKIKVTDPKGKSTKLPRGKTAQSYFTNQRPR